jgi:hypothetical protein
VNTPQHLEKALKPAVTFNNVADRWELKRLPHLKPSTQYTAPYLNKKYLRPFFGQMALEEIKTGVINEWIAELDRKCLQPKTVHNLWKQFRAIMNWHAQQNDEPKRASYPTLPTIPEEEQRWFSQHEPHRILENRDICRRVLKPLCKQLGITPGGMHAFRHGRVSHLQTNGFPADFTKSQVGHSSLRTTSGYTHFS